MQLGGVPGSAALGSAVMRAWVATGIVVASLMVGCGPSPPARWASGGAGVEIAPARWARTGGEVQIASNGVVTVDGQRTLAFDASGRVRDGEGEPYALLEQGGRLVGTDDQVLATVRGASVDTAGSSPSVTVLPNGEIAFKDEKGERRGGAWVGECSRSPNAQSFCSVVAYLVTLEDLRRQERLDQSELRKQRTKSR
jgi:hypothetical protein